jgi:Uncharacterized protein conserved in bacteria (DUF2252)
MDFEATNIDASPASETRADVGGLPVETADTTREAGDAPAAKAPTPIPPPAPDPACREPGGAEAKPTMYLTPTQRASRGKAARADVPRSSHGAWQPAPDRPDPVDLLEAQARTRVPELVPIRYGRMLTSPFAFYRGAAAIMAADLAPLPRSGLVAQLCGDAHLMNFGGFAAPDRRLVFSLNDFDETLPGTFEWDVKRLAASFSVAGRALGFDEDDRRAAVVAGTRSYRTTMREFADMRVMDIWHTRLELDALFGRWGQAAGKQRLKTAERNVAKARTKDSLKALAKLTRVVDGRPRIVSDPPGVVPVEELLPPEAADMFHEVVRTVIRSYRRSLPRDRRKLLERFQYQHAARKVVGVGSVGTRAWIVLLTGRDDTDPVFLQFKEAQASVLEPYLGKSEFTHNGQRVVEGQRMMQAASDLMLGWDRIQGVDGQERDFYIRQLWDAKGSALVETMDPKTLAIYAEICGWTLARAHARSGDPIAIAAYLGTGRVFDEAMGSFAESYADQNERDFAALQDAVADGRVVAEAGT